MNYIKSNLEDKKNNSRVQNKKPRLFVIEKEEVSFFVKRVGI